MHHHTLYTLAIGLAALATPSFALPTSTSSSSYAGPTAHPPSFSHVDAARLRVQGLSNNGLLSPYDGPSPYEGKQKGTSYTTESDCSDPKYIQIDRETLQHDYRDLVCNGRGHLHHTDPLHLSFTLPAATSFTRPTVGGHKSHHIHKHTIAKSRNTQFDMCKQSCLTTPTCVSFSFNGWDSVCNLYSVSLKKQGFIDWREQEVDIEVDETAAHAIWTDVVFWDAGCYVRVCNAVGDEDEATAKKTTTANTTSDADSNKTISELEIEAEAANDSDPEWKLGERVAGFDVPVVGVPIGGGGLKRSKNIELNL